ncbi:DNA polymerase [Methyloceanibacter caenitepidi]|uniref:DNA-directed DNA polymerase n=1 Tax=Methyloceanibacter caenitepidi TaxID=1384459 RepID=A0A0A8K0N0_9HYPH|nr:DNA polymerase [Methyloceanibacter caenitepidi]BAQ16062.1 DNA polymerase I [Methyloceanibacter caenitepidi]
MTNGLHIDFESRSTVDLKKTGTYVYAKHPTTDVWGASFAFGDGPILDWESPDVVPEYMHPRCPPEIAEHVESGGLIYAHNAAFERVMWTHLLGPRYGWPIPKTEQWRCTMVMAYAMALPGALEDAALALGLDVQKDAAGRRLMLQMAKPRGKIKFSKGYSSVPDDAIRVREMNEEGWEAYARTPDGPVIADVRWWNSAEKVERLIKYRRQDVEVERAMLDRLRPLKPSELDLWHLDQKINDRGVCVDVRLCEAAKQVVADTAEKLDADMRAATEGDVTACSNRNQIIAFVKSHGVDTESVAKDQVEEILGRDDIPPVVRCVLNLRRESAKTSVAKIDALLRGMCPDGRARGLLQFLAASTGRWAGRRFQPQNLVRTDEDFPVAEAIDAILGGYCSMAFDEPLNTVSQCLRGMLRAPKGKKLVAVDYRNIEGRMLAWLAGEQWKLDAFRAFDEGTGPDLYKVAYGRSYNMPASEVTKPQRQIGKVMELALGYQGGVGAFQTMAVNYGVQLPEEEVIGIRDAWRLAHPNVKSFWYDLEEAAFMAVEHPGETAYVGERIVFRVAGSWLFMRLPSKRFLAYAYPKIEWKEMPWYSDADTYWKDWGDDESARKFWGDAVADYDADRGMVLLKRKAKKQVVSYMGVNSYTRKWERCYLYGGLLAENATQAASRDILADAMPRLEAAGYPTILTVHDEIVAEVDEDFGSPDEMGAIMVDLPDWAEGAPITAEGWEGKRYRK